MIILNRITHLSIRAARAPLALCALLLLAPLAHAGDIENVDVGLHHSRLVKVNVPVSHFIVTNENISSVVKHDPYTVSVVGHAIGMTDIRLMSQGRVVKQLTVSVLPNVPAIKRFISTIFPYEEIAVEQINGTIALTGFVSSAETARQIQNLVESYLSDGQTERKIKVVNLLKLYSGQQVMLVVKVGEIRKQALSDIGLGARGTVKFAANLLGALERKKVFRVFAEPKLTAISGESAEFLAGGEAPVPVVAPNGANVVEYKPYGVQLKFTPDVMSENRIRVNLETEISEVSKPSGLKYLFKDPYPVFNTRKAQTTVEMASGESFMIAGLISDVNDIKSYNTVKGFDDIPIFRALLASSAFRNNETELVIAVTPHLVHPVSAGETGLPTDIRTPVDPLDTMFNNSLLRPIGNPQGMRPRGRFGFIR